MRKAALIFLSVVVVSGSLAAGGRDASQIDLSGDWKGNITEGDKVIAVGLSLQDEQGQVEGRLSILSDTGEDVDKGMTFDIVQVERSGDILRFIVPLTGQVDDDAIAFKLRVTQEHLQGDGREMREGSEEFAASFTRQATATADQVADGPTVAHGPWRLTIRSRIYDSLVFGETPPPEGKAQARVVAKGTQASTRAFGGSRLEAQTRFIEIQLLFVNASDNEQELTINSLDDFVLSDQGKTVGPFGIRTIGVAHFETPSGVIGTLAGQVTILVPPGEEDSKVVVLFDHPTASGTVAFRFKDFPPISINASLGRTAGNQAYPETRP